MVPGLGGIHGFGLAFSHTDDEPPTRTVHFHHNSHLASEDALLGVMVSFLGAYVHFLLTTCITRLIAHATHRGGG